MSKHTEMIAQKFGRWTVLELTKVGTSGAYFLCRCSCGVERSVSGYNLRHGFSRSCGCLAREEASLRVRENPILGACNKTHGMKRTPEYAAWRGMKARCYNPNSDNYPYYGGRGITVCQQWRNNFEEFYRDLGPRPEGYSLERKDVNGDYTTDNVVWADSSTQCNNRTVSRRITYGERTLTLAQWARETCISRSTISNRIKYGWSVADALTIPRPVHSGVSK